jgi:DNA-binding winged helix-turn-helix (wHTH) protein/WD40 repeat protein
MEVPSNGRTRLSFGQFEADLSLRELYKRGRRVYLQEQPFRILSMLLERPGEVVTREQVRKKVWPDGTFVDFDEGIDTAIKKLRQALGDSAQNPLFIETIPRRGYRLIAPVTGSVQSNPVLPDISEPGPTAGSPQATPSPGGTGSPGRVRAKQTPTAALLKYMFLVAVVVVAAGFFRFYKRLSPRTPPDLKFRQLTINSVENPVTSGAISPDGKYLAYADVKGIHIQLVDTGEVHGVPLPEALRNNDVDWEIVSAGWFPDSTRFLANAHWAGLDPSRWAAETGSVWAVSVMGGEPLKLRGNATAWCISPDGSSISFTTDTGRLGDREVWLMGPAGEQAHKLFDTDENSSISRFHWSPDRKLLVHFRTDASGATLVNRDASGGHPVTVLAPSETENVNDLSWLPDGRLIYSAREPQAVGDTCNYWVRQLDGHTGNPVERPKRLTNWAGFCLNYTSVTKDGKRLVFQESSRRGTGYVADLEAGGTRIRNTRNFTLDESDDAIADWTADGKTVIVVQNRGDHYGLYKQFLNADAPQPIVTAAAGGLLENAQVSPDGKWVILQIYPIPGGPSAPTPLMRVPITGGSPELIFPVPPGSGFSCARPPSSLCVLAEPSVDRKQLIVVVFDPGHGRRGPELARFARDPHLKENAWPLCSISPDGTHLAASSGPEGPIQILSLRGRPTQIIPVSGLNNIRLLGWAGDGNGLFVINGIKDGTAVLHADLLGNSQVLWKCGGGQQCDVTPSPDGRHLAILDRQLSANMWMLENF